MIIQGVSTAWGACVNGCSQSNPFSSLSAVFYKNVVLVWSGNPGLTAKAAAAPPIAPGLCLKQDNIRQGSHGLFSGVAHFMPEQSLMGAAQATIG